MTSMSKKAALLAAASAVGKPMGRGTSWCFYKPYYNAKLDGPSTEIRATSYAEAVRKRTEYTVEVALALMGYRGMPYLDDLRGNARTILDEVLSDPKHYIIEA